MAVVLTLVQTKQIRINIHKRNNTKHTVQKIQNTVNTSTDITKTPTHYKTHTNTRPHITRQVKTTTVQDKHQMKQSQYNQVPSVYILDSHAHCHSVYRLVCSYSTVASVGLSNVMTVDSNKRTASKGLQGLA